MKKRNKFWTVVFSFLPGAGHMFMGFMKRGVSLMAAFFLLFFFSSWLDLGPLLFVQPVLWFYSFFDCINIRWSSDEYFASLKDEYLFSPEQWLRTKNGIQKYGVVIGVVLIVLGLYALASSMLSTLSYYFDYNSVILNAAYSLLHMVPKLLVGVLIIFIGVKLVIGKKKEMNEDD